MDIKITQEKRREVERIQNEFRRRLSPVEIEKATSTAINGVLKRGRNRVKKQVAKEYNITQKYMDRLSVVKPYSKPSSLWGGIQIVTRPLPLIAFGPKQLGSSLYYAIHRGKPKFMRNSFIATVPARSKKGEIVNTHTGAFSRGHYEKGGFKSGREKTETGKIRITQLMGPSPLTMGTYKSIRQDIGDYMGSEVTARVRGILTSRVNRIAKK